jgi:hypothetical protein
MAIYREVYSVASKINLGASYGYQVTNKTAPSFLVPPYQILAALYEGTKEKSVLMTRAYLHTRKGEQDPYSPEFANAFESYMDTLVNKVLPNTSFKIITQTSLSGYIEYTLIRRV